MKLLGIFMAVAMLVSCPIKADERKTLILSEDNTVVMNEAFRGQSVAKLQNKLISLSQTLDEDDEIILVMDSPGGSVIAGMMLIDTVNAIPQKVHTLTIFAASMGYQTVQALGNRYILPSGILMSHRAHIGGLSGQIPGELNTRLAFYEELTGQLDIISSKRVGLSLADYKHLVRDEYWSGSAKSVKENHADEIVNAKCDKSLMGIETKRYDTMFGSFYVDFSKCPLINMPLDIRGGNRTGRLKLKQSFELQNKMKNVEVKL